MVELNEIKKAEAAAMIEHAIEKLKQLQDRVVAGEVIVQDISAGDRLLAQEANGLHNILIDIDYEINDGSITTGKKWMRGGKYAQIPD